MSGITQVWERPFIGSFMDAEELAESNPHGIGTVITLCEKQLRHRNPSINYVYAPVADSSPITVSQYRQVTDALFEGICGKTPLHRVCGMTVTDAFYEGTCGKVLLHCVAGISRTPVIAACWLHSVGYKNIDAALEEIATLRPAIDPSPILLMSIKEHLK
jgi:hypothetical protein